MNRGGPGAARLWLQIDIAQAGAELRAAARGCHGEEPAAHLLGTQVPSDVLLQFGEHVEKAAGHRVPLKSPAQAQQLYQALFQEGLQEVFLQLRGAARGEPLLVRLTPGESALHAVPWEALCRPGSPVDFLGTSQELCFVRGAHSTKSFAPYRVEGAVRLLVISPSDAEAPERLRSVLHPSIQAGELEWLPPLTGAHAGLAYVLHRLRQPPVPHIIHFIGHGGLDAGGNPTLLLTDKEGQESSLKVELLAKELETLFRDQLRLVVLEACEGARPGVLPSAAALLAQAGAGAVVAHLWPVRADVARHCSATFYRSLSGTAAHRGDVARSLHDARRSLFAEFEESAEAFSPVLYLRGYDTALFDIQRKARTRWITRAAAAGGALAVMALGAAWWTGVSESSKPQPGPIVEQAPVQPEPKPKPLQVQSLAGIVRGESGDPVQNAEVSLPKLQATATTDEHGYFQLQARAEWQAPVDVMVHKDGYRTYETPATLGNSGLDIVLRKR